MTKPKFGFAKEDHVMWRRAAWLAAGKEISEDADTWADANDVLHSLLTMDETKETRMAGFGYRRWLDAERGNQAMSKRAVEKRVMLQTTTRSSSARRKMQKQSVSQTMQIDARQKANQTIVPLRTARTALEEVLGHLQSAPKARRPKSAKFEKPVAKHEELDARIAHALANVETVLDVVTDRRGGGWLGLTASERDAALVEELLALREAGYTIEHLAFLVGEPVKECVWQKAAWRRLQRRLSKARKARV